MKEIIIFVFLLSSVLCNILKPKEDLGLKLHNKDNSDWWTNAVVYQIYPRSFKDSDNDGIGDLQGIISKLDHFVDLGVDAIWLSPIYKSPMIDGGYDISDYRAIAEEYGTMDDFMQLLRIYHDQGIKVILDLVPNHTSDLHEWFNKSVARESGYEDFYIWHDGVIDDQGNRSPPNNWISVFSDSAWEWNEKRQQYYFHQFAIQQPDLNYRNEKVHQEIKDVMTYWLDMGVDGFRIDAVPHVYEDELLRDEPVANPNESPNNWNYLDHIYTKDQAETFDLVYSWREHMDNYTARAGGDTRIFMTECATDISNIVRYYGSDSRLGAHFSFNFYLLGLNEKSTSNDVNNIYNIWNTTVGQRFTKNWLTGNHDNPRIATKVGQKHIDGYNMLIMFLDGVTITYMGEEIGQENGEVTCSEGQDPAAIKNCSTFDQVSRDFERTPYQWDTTVNAGFNEGAKPWLPVSSKYLETNLENQKGENNSHYKIYKKLVELKKENFDLLNFGIFNEAIYGTRVSEDGNSGYLFFYNVDSTSTTISMQIQDVSIVAQSVGMDYKVGEPLILSQGDAIIFKLFIVK